MAWDHNTLCYTVETDSVGVACAAVQNYDETETMRHAYPPDELATPTQHRRAVLYSHDTFGLGHLRRSRALASALTQSGVVTSAIILTGSPVAGSTTGLPRSSKTGRGWLHIG